MQHCTFTSEGIWILVMRPRYTLAFQNMSSDTACISQPHAERPMRRLDWIFSPAHAQDVDRK